MDTRITDIPVEIWANQIPLNFTMINALEQTNKHFRFFNDAQETGYAKQIRKLIHLIFHDKVKEITELLTINPKILFSPVAFITQENTIETISAWEYAYKLLNVEVIKLFNPYIEPSNPGFENQSLLNLEPYESAVEKYDAAYVDYLEHKLSKKEINLEWLKLGEAQKIIPVWLLKKMLFRWNTTAHNIHSHHNPTITIDISDFKWSRLGELTLFRGNFYDKRVASKGRYSHEAISSTSVTYDLYTIQGYLQKAEIEMKEIIPSHFIKTASLK